jgi:hypothetical protein
LKFETIVQSSPTPRSGLRGFRPAAWCEPKRPESKISFLKKHTREFASIIDGYQIINPLDERTRPTHAVRAGRVYWNDRRKTPHAEDRPALPDAANCRCTYAPVLNAPAPEELLNGPRVDTRTYAGFFNKLTDKEKAKIVGADRWDLMKSKTRNPSWWDSIDPKTGRFVSVQ